MKILLGKILLGIIAIGYSVAGLAKPLSPAYFAKNASYDQVKLSPDGQHLAVTIPFPNRSVLAILDRETKEAKSLFQYGNEKYIDEFEWVSNKRVVFTQKYKTHESEKMYIAGHVFAADINGTREKVIFGKNMYVQHVGTRVNNKRGPIDAWGEIAHTLPDDPKNILVSAVYFSSKEDGGENLFKVNVQNGDRKFVTRTPVGRMQLAYDRSGETIFAMGHDRAGVYSGQIFKDGEWTKIKKTDKLANLTPVSISSNGNTIYFSAYVDRSTKSLFRYDVANDELHLDFQDPISDIYDFVIEPGSNRVVGVKTMPGKIKTHYFDKKDKFSKLHRSLSKAFGGQDLTITSETEDGKFLILLAQSDKNPGDFFLFDTDKMNADYLMSRKQWIDPDTMGTRQPISFNNSEGITLHGYITWPIDTSKPVPLVTLVHGGPYGIKDSWYFDSEAQMLANHGYAVLQINYRGSQGYGLDYKETAYRKFATMIQQDINDATRWALKLDKIADDKVCIAGTSFGGTSAVFAPILAPSLYQCSIAIAGVFDEVKQEDTADYSSVETSANQAKKIYGESEEELTQSSAITHIDKFKTPILIAHGGQDKRVLPEQSELLRDALQKRKVPYEWFFKEKEGHGFQDEKNREELYQKMIDFLDKHLKS